METVTFEIHHLITFKLEMVEFPELTSPKKWIQKGIDLLKKYAPRMLTYLSKQRVMAQLKDHKIIIEIKHRKKRRKKQRQESFTASERRERWTRRIFKVWIQKEKGKRLLLVILEGLVIPFTPILALLPGPNIFFYIPALLLYYHLTSYLGLLKVDVDDLAIEIKHERV